MFKRIQSYACSYSEIKIVYISNMTLVFLNIQPVNSNIRDLISALHLRAQNPTADIPPEFFSPHTHFFTPFGS